MTRTSPAEVRGLFRRLVTAAGAAGVDASAWSLVEGDIGIGKTWRLSGASETFNGYLGATIREASLSLLGMVKALEMVPARGAAVQEPPCGYCAHALAAHAGPGCMSPGMHAVPAREGVR